MSEDFFNIDFPGYAPLEIKLNDADDFLKVRETLSRIGVASRKDKVLYQSCHILHKKGRYFITHFKELFALDGKDADFDDSDDDGLRDVQFNKLRSIDNTGSGTFVITSGDLNVQISRNPIGLVSVCSQTSFAGFASCGS